MNEHLEQVVVGRKAAAPAATPTVQVEALTNDWLMHGERVAIGERYSVPMNECLSLEFRGKARRCSSV